MNTYKILSFGILIISSILSFAQRHEPFLDAYTYHKNQVDHPTSRANEYAEVEGSPYLNYEFTEGVVYLRDSTAYKLLLRFNIFSNEMEYKLNDVTYVLGNPQAVSQIHLGKSVFVYGPDINGGGYFELLQSGKCALLQKRSVHYQPSEGPKPIEGTITPARFIKEADVYYVIPANNGAVEVENKKSLMLALGDHKTEVENYIKKEKIRISKRESLMLLIGYYNTL